MTRLAPVVDNDRMEPGERRYADLSAHTGDSGTRVRWLAAAPDVAPDPLGVDPAIAGIAIAIVLNNRALAYADLASAARQVGAEAVAAELLGLDRRWLTQRGPGDTLSSQVCAMLADPTPRPGDGLPEDWDDVVSVCHAVAAAMPVAPLSPDAALPPLPVRNVAVDLADPVVAWPQEAMLNALERGGVGHWRKVAAALGSPSVRVAVREALACMPPTGVARAFADLLTQSETQPPCS